jgi:S-adenosylmethionine hydrolase
LIITLMTDFGSASAYVAEMKGVLLSRAPGATVVDVCHDLPRHDVRAAQLLLRRTAWAFPLGSVHLVVVDPSVGSPRRGLALRTRGILFVGPDNGTFGALVGGAEVRALENQTLFSPHVSPTFHGRDIFAPVAAELALGLDFADVGPSIDDPVPGVLPLPTAGAEGVVLGADTFGNLTTNLLYRPCVALRVGDMDVPVVRTFSDVAPGEALAYCGSDGFFAIAVREGCASTRFGAHVPVRLCAPD